MPAKTLPPDFFAKYGTQINEAIRSTASEPANPGIVRLPGGISTGIAQLQECYFGTGEKGDYWRASGKIVAPTVVGPKGAEIPVKGLQTSIVEMLTGDDVGDAFKRIANHLKLLAGDKLFATLPKEVLSDPARMGAYLQTLSGKIADKHPYFRFSTELSKVTPQHPTPRVWERWHGTAGLEGYTEHGAGTNGTAHVADAPKPWSEAEKPVTPAPKAADPARPKAPPKPVEPEPEPEPFPLDDDVPALIDRANNQGDETARERLKQLCAEKGHSEDDFENAGWDEIEAWLAEETGADTGAAAETNVPVANETVLSYAPPDPKDKTKTKRLAAVQAEVIEVDDAARTMTLRSVANKRHVWKAVAWADPNVEWDS